MSGFRPTLPPPGIDFHVQVANITIPVNSAEVTSGSYGSVGHARFSTSQTLLSASNIDLMALASSSTIVSVDVYAETPTVPHTKIFGGDLLATEWGFDQDMVHVHARDHAGVFVDQKRILARDAKAVTAALTPLSPGQQLNPNGVATMNRSVSQVVTDIANEFGYTPVINMEGGSNVMAGALYGGDHTYMTIPQNLWSILNTLARDTGNEVYTTPDRKLVFGMPGAGLSAIQLMWNMNPGTLPTTWQSPTLQTVALPCANLQITHNPRRNSSFRVLVTSYDPGKAQITLGRATAIGSDLATSSLPEGVSVGAAAQAADNQLLADAKAKNQGISAGNLSHIQLYTFHWDGLTSDDANARAAAIAADIQKRLLLLRCTIDGLPTLTPTQPLTLQGPISSTFLGNVWYVSGFQHKFELPHAGGHRGWSGYTTEIQALDLPSVSLAQTLSSRG